MAITTTDVKKQYTPSTAQTVFPFDIRYFEAADINVEVVDSEGTTTVLTLNAPSDGFSVVSVNGNPENGAIVTTTESYTSGDTVTIYRKTEAVQETIFYRGGDLPPEILNISFDRSFALSQEIMEASTRAITCPVTDGSGLTYELPTVDLRKGKAVGFDANGNVVALNLASSGTVSGDANKAISVTNNIISTKVDASTINWDISGNLYVPDSGIKTAQINDGAITVDKMANQSVYIHNILIEGANHVIGNMTGLSNQSAQDIEVQDDDLFASPSATKLASSESIKAFILAQTAPNIAHSIKQDTETYTGTANTWYEVSGINPILTTKRTGSDFRVSLAISWASSNLLYGVGVKVMYSKNGGAYTDFNLPTSPGSRNPVHFSMFNKDFGGSLCTVSGDLVLDGLSYNAGDTVAFKVYVQSLFASATLYVNRSHNDTDSASYQRSVSTVIAEEIYN